jgi:ABC-type transport system involved in multi-copper enzyme maturation permease subunit
MKNLIEISIFSLKENLKTKIYLVLLLFGIGLIFLGLLLTGLSGFEQPQRVLVNTGIAMIELFCLLLVILNSVELFLQDVETKSIYIVLSKPISRTKYIIGKYFGTLITIFVSILVMSIFHMLLIKISKWGITKEYFLTILSIFLKMFIVSSITLFSVVSMTSRSVAVITSVLLWIAGHFTSELMFMIKKIKIVVVKILLEIFYYIIPNFQLLNLKDYFDSPYFVAQFSLLKALVYTVIYSAIFLFLTCLMFKNKDL